jgi:GntR family transcriptional regulator
MKLSKGHIPLYFQFYLQFKQDIITGEIPPGERIMSIEELYQHYDISQGTVRKAMELLENEGLIVRKQRLGTFVNENIDRQLWTPIETRDEFKERIKFDNIETLSDGWVMPPNRVRRVFKDQNDVLKDGRIFKVQYLVTGKEDKRRKVLSYLYIPNWVLKLVPRKKFKKEPIQILLTNQKLFKISGVKQIIRPWFCDSDSAQLIGVPEGTPIFHRTWIFYLEGDLPFHYLENLTTAYALERYLAFKK